MKFIGAVLILMVATSLPASAQFDVNWGVSQDSPQKGGDYYLADWLYANYQSRFNNDYSRALDFARTGYIGYGAQDADPYYWNTAPGTSTFTIEQEIAGYSSSNMYGYYAYGDSADRNVIFTGADNPSTPAKTLSIQGAFGLYLNAPTGSYWYTDRQLNADNAPQALVYELESGRKWLVAFEDLKYSQSDKDFNDAYLTVTATPEPLGMVLFGLGAGVIGMNTLKRKRIVTKRS